MASMLRALAGRIGRALIAWDRAGGPERALEEEAAQLERLATEAEDWGRRSTVQRNRLNWTFEAKIYREIAATLRRRSRP